MKKHLKIPALVFALMLVLCSCGSNEKEDETELSSLDITATTESAGVTQYDTDFEDGEHPQALFTMEDGSTFVIELYPEYAPQTCQNFINLVSEGFYDGLTFHRVINDFMAQGGDPNGDGSGGPGYTIEGEFSANGFTQNTLSHKRGVVSMGRKSSGYDTAGCQFFICYADCSYLDGQYAAFGKVIQGMDTIDSFLEVERTGSEGGTPVTPIVIQSAVMLAEADYVEATEG